MKILLISQFYAPETGAGSVRIEEFAKSWKSHGHEVTVLTGFPCYPKYEIFPGYTNKFISREVRDGIDIIRIFTHARGKSSIFSRSLGQFLFMLFTIIGGLFAPRPDIIIASSPPFTIGFTALILGFLRRRPFVLDIRDPYPMSPIELGVVKNKTLISFLKTIERLYYRTAVRVVTVTEGFRSILIRGGCPENKCLIVANGVNTKFFTRLPVFERAELKKRLGYEGKVCVVYTGTLGRVHNIGIMVEAARVLRDDPDIHFLIVGNGVKRDSTEELIKKYSLTNFTVMDPVNRDKVKEILSMADIGFQALEDIDYIAFAHAVKLFEYMALKLPVVFSGRGESKRLIDEAKGGITCAQDSLDEVVDALRLLKSNPDLRAELGENGRSYTEKYHDRSQLSKKFLDILTSLREGLVSPGMKKI